MKNFSVMLFAAVCSIAILSGCSENTAPAAAEQPPPAAAKNTPMDHFKRLRQAVIDNDSSTLLAIADKEFLAEVKRHGISADLKKIFFNIKSAYEEVSVRQSTPTEALVCAFFDLRDVEQRVTVKMHGSGSNMKIVSVEVAANTPEPSLELFMRRCSARDKAFYQTMVSKDITAKYPNIPEGLITPITDFRQQKPRFRGDTAVISINRNGTKGNISMEKNGIFWKITDIDDVFFRASPALVAQRMMQAAASKNIAALTPLVTPGALKEFSGDIPEKHLARFSSARLTSERIYGSTAQVSFSFDNPAEKGNITLSFFLNKNTWQVTKVSYSNIVSKEPPPAPAAPAAPAAK